MECNCRTKLTYLTAHATSENVLHHRNRGSDERAQRYRAYYRRHDQLDEVKIFEEMLLQRKICESVEMEKLDMKLQLKVQRRSAKYCRAYW